MPAEGGSATKPSPNRILMGSVALTGITMMSSCMTSRTKRSTRQAKCRAEGRELSAQLAAKLDSFRAMLFRSRPHIRIQKEETGVVTMSDLASTSRVAPPPRRHGRRGGFGWADVKRARPYLFAGPRPGCRPHVFQARTHRRPQLSGPMSSAEGVGRAASFWADAVAGQVRPPRPCTPLAFPLGPEQ